MHLVKSNKLDRNHPGVKGIQDCTNKGLIQSQKEDDFFFL